MHKLLYFATDVSFNEQAEPSFILETEPELKHSFRTFLL